MVMSTNDILVRMLEKKNIVNDVLSHEIVRLKDTIRELRSAPKAVPISDDEIKFLKEGLYPLLNKDLPEVKKTIVLIRLLRMIDKSLGLRDAKTIVEQSIFS